MLLVTPAPRRFFCFSLALLALLSLGPTAGAQAPAPPGVRVSGAGLAKPTWLSAADLARLPRLEVSRPDHDGHPHTYSGAALFAVLTAASANFSPVKLPGKGLAHYVQVGAADGYQVVFALAELNPDFSPRPVLLADRCDGQPLSAQDGPYQIIVPDERKMGRCVRQVQTLRIVDAKKM